MFWCERKGYLVVLISMEIASIYNEVRATCHLVYIYKLSVAAVAIQREILNNLFYF